MALFDVIGELYDPNADVKPRFLVNQGGTSSGKTYTIMQRLIVLSFEHPMAIITVCGQDLPNLKVGAMRDLDTILHTRAELLDWFKNNKSDSSYRGKNGSIIEFKSYQDAQDAKNGKRDYLFVNEANGVPYEVFWQLAIRTRKQVFIDYNPSARFWVHNNIIGRDDCRLILSDHRNNRFLTAQEHKKIEEINDPELWRVYARGLTGKITGLIFTNWGIVDNLPPHEEWKMDAYGLDFGFSCFKGDTLIETNKGLVPIAEIKSGDMVLTRCGYRKVLHRFDNGQKKVIKKRITTEAGTFEMSATGNHNFNVNGKWKKYGRLTEGDKLCVLSPTKASNTKDTQTASTQTIIATSGRRTENITAFSYITQYGKNTMEKSQMGMLSTTETRTHSITTSRTCSLSLLQNMLCCIKKSWICLKGAFLQQLNTAKRIGKKEERKQWQDCNQRSEFADGVEMNTQPQTYINVSARNFATTDGNTEHQKTTSKWFASVAEKPFSETSILNQSVARENVRILSVETLQEETCEVYDLWIEGVHEYFANGILVHNCDPTALEHVILAHGELWVDEEIYQPGLTNEDIADRCKEQGLTKRDLIIADSAEPKSIQEIHNQGLWIIPSTKGKDSINNGIDILKRFRINITRRSNGIIENMQQYKWKKSRDGETTNQPIDAFNHGIDAIRYVALKKLSVASHGTARAHVLIQ